MRDMLVSFTFSYDRVKILDGTKTIQCMIDIAYNKGDIELDVIDEFYKSLQRIQLDNLRQFSFIFNGEVKEYDLFCPDFETKPFYLLYCWRDLERVRKTKEEEFVDISISCMNARADYFASILTPHINKEDASGNSKRNNSTDGD